MTIAPLQFQGDAQEGLRLLAGNSESNRIKGPKLRHGAAQ